MIYSSVAPNITPSLCFPSGGCAGANGSSAEGVECAGILDPDLTIVHLARASPVKSPPSRPDTYRSHVSPDPKNSLAKIISRAIECGAQSDTLHLLAQEGVLTARSSAIPASELLAQSRHLGLIKRLSSDSELYCNLPVCSVDCQAQIYRCTAQSILWAAL